MRERVVRVVKRNENFIGRKGLFPKISEIAKIWDSLKISGSEFLEIKTSRFHNMKPSTNVDVIPEVGRYRDGL